MPEDGITARRRKLFAFADQYDLTREERIEFAEYLLRRDVTSWKNLSDAQVCRLLDAFEGAELLMALASLRT